MPKSPPPHKTPFSQRREREFLYLLEVDALIAALEHTRSPYPILCITQRLQCFTHKVFIVVYFFYNNYYYNVDREITKGLGKQ